MTIGQKIANGIKDFFSRLFNDGAVSTRSSRLESLLQGMQRATIAQCVQGFKDGLQASRQMLQQQNHTPQNHARVCAQCMTDNPAVETFVLNHLNDPDYSKEKFSGIENHPNDPSKFIAKFGDKQLKLSNRISSNNELRGNHLKDLLANSNYQNLGELLGKDYLTAKDSFLIVCFTAPTLTLASTIQDFPPAMKEQIIASISNLPMGNTTVGEAFPNVLHPPQ
ncbi:MAG: hypothetical protein H6R18_413 [Proteobacteria bacterium]|nr:hypothetical protein [Pseudomonadota bacterium]